MVYGLSYACIMAQAMLRRGVSATYHHLCGELGTGAHLDTTAQSDMRATKVPAWPHVTRGKRLTVRTPVS